MRKRRRIEPRVLLVEGKDEQRLLPELLELGGIHWPSGSPPVWIEEMEGIEQILEAGSIEVELKATGLRSLGVIVDADEDLQSQWNRVRQRLVAQFPEFPADLDPSGVTFQAEDGRRVGVWLMPDNVRSGMLETLLLAIRRGEPSLAEHAASACEQARGLGAPFRELHRHKAELHTWLAWQDPPGQQMHIAMRMKMLSVDNPSGRAFVAWVKRLHDL